MSEQITLFVEITSKEIRFLLQKKTKGNLPELYLEIFRAGEEDDLSEAGKLMEILRNYRRKISGDQRKIFGNKKVPVYLLLPYQDGLIREAKFPWIREKDRYEAVKFYLQHEMPAIADELVFQPVVSGEKQGESLHILITAVPKERINFYRQVFHSCGYRLKGAEYALSARTGIMKLKSQERLLTLALLTDSSLELVLYRGDVPEIIREMPCGEFGPEYNLYFGASPVDFLWTDGSPQAEREAALLLASGLVKERLAQPDIPGRPDAEFKAGALYGEILRVEDQNNINLVQKEFSPVFRETKGKLAAVFLVLLFGAAGLSGTYLYWENMKVQRDIIALRENLQKIEEEGYARDYSRWQELKASGPVDLQSIQRAVLGRTDGIRLTGWSYKQGLLSLRAESKSNQAILDWLSHLQASGWRQPYLDDYLRQKENITFSLTVIR